MHRCIVPLIGLPIDADTLHAVLRLLLRLTRDHEFAAIFRHLNGPRLLLRLTQQSAFQGFSALATLILRHALEEPAVLSQAIEKVL